MNPPSTLNHEKQKKTQYFKKIFLYPVRGKMFVEINFFFEYTPSGV